MTDDLSTTPSRIYLIRHATPDWSRKDIPYNLPPGPPLIEQGEMEAVQLGGFIKQARLSKLYYSPLERAKRTAEIIAGLANIPTEEAAEIAEMRPSENDQEYLVNMLPLWNRAIKESRQGNPIGLVTHGGPIRIMLETLGLTTGLIEAYNERFDGHNPLPPAGVWMAEKCAGETRWNLELVFVPMPVCVPSPDPDLPESG